MRAYTLVFDGYADWELGHVLAELRRFGKVEVVSVGFSDKVVVSMGGLRVLPDQPISAIEIEDVLIFILPGGYLWEGTYPKAEIEQLLHRLENAKRPIAAICAATTVIARAGLLRGRKHTSNSRAYLSKMVPEYQESDHYIDSLSTRDRGIVTASGLGSIEFTMEIFNELDLATPQMRATWYAAFKHGKYPQSAKHGA
ncbi:MAG: thiamine biosynthesis protein ThiJ [Desulfobacteraceae bacterium]|nr:MAG: thiamine biosynthesis protein ThiJ [Desulfobacteraceae bacterium]